MNLTHVHLVLNHVPVLLTIVGLALLVWAVLRRSSDVRAVSLVLFVVGAAVAAAVYATGEPAEKAVKSLPGINRVAIERHADAAGIALGGILALGAVSLASLVLGITPVGRRLGRTLVAIPLLLSFAAGGLMIWTASLGGTIRHTEIGGGSPAVTVHAAHH